LTHHVIALSVVERQSVRGLEHRPHCVTDGLVDLFGDLGVIHFSPQACVFVPSTYPVGGGVGLLSCLVENLPG
jgi:hypothetical protein